MVAYFYVVHLLFNVFEDVSCSPISSYVLKHAFFTKYIFHLSFDITVLFSSSSSFPSSLFLHKFRDNTPLCNFFERAEFFLACYLLVNRADAFFWTIFFDHLALFHSSPQSSTQRAGY